MIKKLYFFYCFKIGYPKKRPWLEPFEDSAMPTNFKKKSVRYEMLGERKIYTAKKNSINVIIIDCPIFKSFESCTAFVCVP